jgi:hypothetical protein
MDQLASVEVAGAAAMSRLDANRSQSLAALLPGDLDNKVGYNARLMPLPRKINCSSCSSTGFRMASSLNGGQAVAITGLALGEDCGANIITCPRAGTIDFGGANERAAELQCANAPEAALRAKETHDSVTNSYLGVGHSSLILRTQLLYSP